VLLLSWLFFLLALQMFGLFETDWLNANWGGGLARKSGWVGSFFTGVLAVVVASPCTAPFMGAALGFALSQSIGTLFLVFALLGVGLSTPYLLFAIFPSWGRYLPKPGAWMETVKQFFAFPLLLTCVWLVWLLAESRGNFALAIALGGMVGWSFVIWLKNRAAATMVAILILVSGVTTLWKMPPPALAAVTEGWAPFSTAALQRSGDETVFVDFTADWCLTCKVNERLVLSQSDIVEFLKKNHVRLVKGDWTNRDAEITKFLNKYQRAGVPFYIVFGPGAPDGKILPELLTPEIFRREMESVLQSKGGTP
jgi:thiol:disulfide interchange protein